MNSAELKKYYDVILSIGVNLYKGQCLLIASGVENHEFAYGLADAAYEKGAMFVEVNLFSNKLTRSRVEKSADSKFLEYVPSYPAARLNEQVANDWAYIRIDNLEEIDVLKGIDPERYTSMIKKEHDMMKNMSKAVSSAKIQWCIVGAPGPQWAARSVNKPVSAETDKEFSSKLAKVLRLDQKDPVAAWTDIGNKLIARAQKLTDMNLAELHFEGPGTDLRIYLNDNTFWKGGFTNSQSGRKFIPNIPTEEVFTTPDYRRTSGRVAVTKPVKVMENQINGIWFEFKDGKIINFGCDNDKELLEKFLDTDEGSRSLGEVALVDIDSEVHKSGIIFNSILYDENAACHIAVGRGIPMCFSNFGELKTADAMLENGCNESHVHTDFMIGSPQINVTGRDRKGAEKEIIKEGKFCI